MKNEAAFWGAVRKRLVDAGWLAWKVPAEIRKGLPDVFLGKNGGSAWVELKYRPRWPARDDTPVHVDVSPEQHAHLRDLRAADLDGFVLLGVEDDVFILDDIAPMQKKPVPSSSLDTGGVVLPISPRDSSRGSTHHERLPSTSSHPHVPTTSRMDAHQGRSQ